MEGERQDQKSPDPIEKGEDVDRLLAEFGSLYASLAKHQRPMAILFADLKGSTALFGERSDIEGLIIVQRIESLVRPAVERHSGTVIKTIGDCVMASFPSADDAVFAAIAIQHALEEHNREIAPDDQLSLRIGINTGKGFVKDQDIFGQVVNIAAKIQAAAEGDQILVSQATVQALSPKPAQRAEPFGTLEVPGLAQPIEVHEILWHEEPHPPRTDPLRGRPREAEEEQKLLVLDLSLEGGRLKVSAFERYPGEEQTLKPYHEVAYPGEVIETLRTDLIQLLNRANRQGVLDQGLVHELERLGLRLFDALFPLPVKESLRSALVDDLIIHIDDKLVQIPWELFFDGEQFFSKRFNMGRVVRTRQTLSDVSVRQLQYPLKMLILANPRGDLEAAYQEGVTLKDALADHEAKVTVDFVSHEVTPNYAKKHLLDYDIVHFAGHAEYHLEAPEASAWLLRDGELTSSDILTMAGEKPLPALVFANACQSGYTEEWRVSEHLGQEIYGLANAFLRAGVQHYIGTFWEIPDAPSGQFALAFYSHLIKGSSVGWALRQARKDLVERSGTKTVIWTSYMLYGDPTVCLFPYEREKSPRVLVKPAQSIHLKETVPAQGTPAVQSGRIAPLEKTRRGVLGKGMAAAVAVCLLLVGGLYFFSGSSTEHQQSPPSPKPSVPITSGTTKGLTLTISQVQRILVTSKNFDFQDLSGLNLRNIDLSGANFEGADLTGANLSQAALWKSQLSKANLSHANLSGAKLGKANLAEAVLQKATLSEADLSGANLQGANLSGADLARAQLWGANLEKANLRGAILTEANLLHTNLKGADLSKANLRGANLNGADLEGANFAGANLEGVKDLLRAKNVDKAVALRYE